MNKQLIKLAEFRIYVSWQPFNWLWRWVREEPSDPYIASIWVSTTLEMMQLDNPLFNQLYGQVPEGETITIRKIKASSPPGAE